MRCGAPWPGGPQSEPPPGVDPLERHGWERRKEEACAYWLQLDDPVTGDLIEVKPWPGAVRVELDATCVVNDCECHPRPTMTPEQAEAMADVLRAAAAEARRLAAEKAKP